MLPTDFQIKAEIGRALDLLGADKKFRAALDLDDKRAVVGLMERLRADKYLLGAVSLWKSSPEESEVLRQLKAWNEAKERAKKAWN